MQLRLRMDGVTPDAVTARELADFVVNWCDLLAAVQPGTDAGLALSGIEDNCILFRFEARDRPTLRSYIRVVRSVAIAGILLPAACMKPAAKINSFLANQHATLSLPRGNKKEPAKVSAEKQLRAEEAAVMEYGTTIYGELTEIGGSRDAKAHVDAMGYDNILICTLTRDQAQKLAPKLYSFVGLKGLVSLSREGTHPTMAVEDILPFEDNPHSDPFEPLRSLGASQYFTGVDAEEFVKAQRG